MTQSYVETIEKLQQQGLDALKQAQAAQIAALTSVRELVSNASSKLPAAPGLGAIPAVVSQVSELNSAFAVKLIEQQNDYMTQLVNLLKPVEREAAAETTATA